MAHPRLGASAVELACRDLPSRCFWQGVNDLVRAAVRKHVPVYASALGLDPDHQSTLYVAARLSASG